MTTPPAPTRTVDVRLESAPAMGDIRELPAGSWIYVFPNAKRRGDWGRYLAAITEAIAHGVNVVWLEESGR